MILASLRLPNSHLPPLEPASPCGSMPYCSFSPLPAPGLDGTAQCPLPLAGESYTVWEARAQEAALTRLKLHADDFDSDEFAQAAYQLAELGMTSQAEQALRDRIDKHPGDARSYGKLGQVMLMAGKPKKALACARAAAAAGGESMMVANLEVKAYLLMGARCMAQQTLNSQKRRSSLTSSMVKHAMKSPVRSISHRETGVLLGASDASEYFGWQGYAGHLVKWFDDATHAREYLEIARVTRSPFIAPVTTDGHLRQRIEALGLKPATLVGFGVHATRLPSPLHMPVAMDASLQ